MKKHSPAFLQMVQDAKTRVKEMTVGQVKEKMDRGDSFHLVDVREDHEWKRSHLPGAIHLSKGIIERDIETTIPDPHSEIILYCGGGYRSAMSADNLQKMGYTHVVSMDGGYSGWSSAGYPLVTDQKD